MIDAWSKASQDERIRELDIARHAALGHVLGTIDMVMLAEEHPTVFKMADYLARLRDARKQYDIAAARYLDARLTAK